MVLLKTSKPALLLITTEVFLKSLAPYTQSDPPIE